MRAFGSLRRRPTLAALLPRWALVGLISSVAACATHRGEPPKCKGAFTPINQPAAVVSNGSQR
jgi:hypothetical protein